MRILHFYPADDSLISQYVTMLCENMGLECTNETVTDPKVVQQRLRSSHYDILHLHGCWRISLYLVVRQAIKNHTRIVVSPHGQLNPWVLSENYWKEKMPKRLLFQKHIIQRAYAVIVQGRIEDESLTRLGWNHRIVTVRNAIITRSIKPAEMASQIFKVYRQVLDSNPLELMDEDLRHLTSQLITTGITGDKRWIDEEPLSQPDTLEGWRQLLCYAHQEQITDTVRRGLYIFGFDVPDLDVTHIPYFLPDGYKQPTTIEKTIGLSFVTENDRLMATFRLLSKLSSHRQLSIMHLIELDKELREHGCDEDALAERLEDRHLLKFAGRIMYVLQENTGFTEGFMPVPARYDRAARKLCKQVENHLNI